MIPQILSPSGYLLEIKICAAAAALYTLYLWVNAPDPQATQAKARAELIEADARARDLATSRAVGSIQKSAAKTVAAAR